MVTDNHYRWDFIQLSTDVKPTPATSKKVTDGSTLYTSDDSKLYVWYKDQWYEKEAPGDSSYTAGDGIDISNNTISVDTDTIQEKLTAGTNITIDNNVISAAGGGITELTSADYNWPADNPDGVALWLLPAGVYVNSGIKVYIDTSFYGTNTIAGRAFVVFPDSANSVVNILYSGIASGAEGNFAGLRVAVTNKNNGSPKNPLSGYGLLQQVLRVNDVVNSLTSTYTGVPLSAYQGKVLNDKIGGDLSNLTTTDKTSLINAINEVAGQITPTTDSSAPTTATVGRLGQIQIDTTTNTAYMCVAVDDVTPSYTWKQITA